MTVFEGPPLAEQEGIGALTMGAFLEEVAGRFAAREALVFDDPLQGGRTVRWTYADLRERAREVGRALLALGVERGEAVDTAATFGEQAEEGGAEVIDLMEALRKSVAEAKAKRGGAADEAEGEESSGRTRRTARKKTG